MSYEAHKKQSRTAPTVRPELLQTCGVLNIMHKNKRSAQPEKELTRYDFERPADLVLSMPKKVARRFADEFNKQLAMHGAKTDE